MADRSFLDWPFLEPAHRALHDRVEAWATANARPCSTRTRISVGGRGARAPARRGDG